MKEKIRKQEINSKEWKRVEKERRIWRRAVEKTKIIKKKKRNGKKKESWYRYYKYK